MKKLALVAFAMFVAGTGAAVADQVAAVPGLGELYTNQDGYVVVAEGHNGLPVLDGYVGLGEDGQCHGSQTGDRGHGSTDPVCSAPG